jgi:hypothetical protein
MASQKQPQSKRYRDTPFWNVYDGLSQAIDRWVGWPRLAKPVGLLVLIGLRNILRQQNLYDTSQLATQNPAQPGPPTPASRAAGPPTAPTTTFSSPRWGWPVPVSAGTSRCPQRTRNRQPTCSPPITNAFQPWGAVTSK